MLWIAFTTLAIGYMACCLVLFLMQSKFIYFPFKELDATPKDIGLDYEELTLRASDGVGIGAWLVPRSDARGVALFCHGNAGNISHCLPLIKTLHDAGCSVLAFDYRGFGKSGGKPSEQGTYDDAQAAWDYLVKERRVPAERIVVFGWSLGGAVAARLAANLPPERRPGSVILSSSFSSIADMARKHYPIFPVRLLLRFEYPTAANASKIKSPVLVIHSRDDEIVPLKQGRKIFDSITSEKSFLETTGGHNDDFGLGGRDSAEALHRFIDSHLPPGPLPL